MNITNKGDKMRKLLMVVGIFSVLSSAAFAGQGVWKTTPNMYGGWDTSYCSYCYKI